MNVSKQSRHSRKDSGDSLPSWWHGVAGWNWKAWALQGEGTRVLRRGDRGLPCTPWPRCPHMSREPGSCVRLALGPTAVWSSRAIPGPMGLNAAST